MRIGVFGLTGNPFHYGHLEVGKWARDTHSLDKVLYVVNNDPPHKNHDVASAYHRLYMAHLGLLSEPGLEESDIEISRGGVSYMVDTLNELHTYHDELFLIMGDDAHKEFHTWHKPGEITALADLLVYEGNILPVRATQLRQFMKTDPKLILGLVPPEVASYIYRNNLYI